MNEQITDKHILRPYLTHELTQIQILLDSIRVHKTKRSLDFIGSAWKWIAGNPDHEDFEVIKDKINNVLKNNNRQAIINQLYNERINNITRLANDIKNSINRENLVTDQLISSIQYKLRLIKEEIVNIKYAVHWAKAGIINSFVLSDKEIKVATEILDKENLPFATISEALDFANVKVISNSSCLLYIVYIPMTASETYVKLQIKPVKRNGRINEIAFKEILQNKNKIYGIKKNCKTLNTLSVCKAKDVVDISSSSCLPNLLQSRPSICDQANGHHVPTVDEITEGLILLNQFSGIILVQNETYNLTGTFLIKFHNTSLSINDRTFTSREQSIIQAVPAIMQPTPREKQLKEILSLEMMKDIHINNTDQIGLLQANNTTHQIISYGSGLLIMFGILGFGISKIFRCWRGKFARVVNITNLGNSDSNPTQQPEEGTPEQAQHQSAQLETTKTAQLETTTFERPKPIETSETTVPVAARRKFYETPFF